MAILTQYPFMPFLEKSNNDSLSATPPEAHSLQPSDVLSLELPADVRLLRCSLVYCSCTDGIDEKTVLVGRPQCASAYSKPELALDVPFRPGLVTNYQETHSTPLICHTSQVDSGH